MNTPSLGTNTEIRGNLREDFEANVIKTMAAAEGGPLEILFHTWLSPLIVDPKKTKQRNEIMAQVGNMLASELGGLFSAPTSLQSSPNFSDLVQQYFNKMETIPLQRELMIPDVLEQLVLGNHTFFTSLWGKERGDIVKEIVIRRLEGIFYYYDFDAGKLKTNCRTKHYLESYAGALSNVLVYWSYWAAYDKSALEAMQTLYCNPEMYNGTDKPVLCDVVAPWLALEADKKDKDIIELCRIVTNEENVSEMMFTALFYSHRQSQWQKACDYLTPKCKKKILKALFSGCLNGNTAALAFLIQYILENDLTAVPDIAERIAKLPFCSPQYKDNPEELKLHLTTIHTLLTDDTKRKQAFMNGSESERDIAGKVQQCLDWSEGVQWSYEQIKTPELSSERKLEALEYVVQYKKLSVEEAADILRGKPNDPVFIDRVVHRIGWNTIRFDKKLYQMVLDDPQKLTRQTIAMVVSEGFPRIPNDPQKQIELYNQFRSLVPIIPLVSESVSKNASLPKSMGNIWLRQIAKCMI
ncbi:MAG: hypothetical protein PHQ75_06615 [Thermoguttaceae bacterium]|nr:hypothetical protein [Thermoguttaceae bacterium]